MTDLNFKALLLLDFQNEMVSKDGKVGGGGLAKIVADQGVLENAAKLLELFRNHKAKVIYVRVGFKPDFSDVLSKAPRIANLKKSGALVIDSWATELPAVIAPQKGELIITKQCVNPFFNTQLQQVLEDAAIQEVVLCGVMTNLVVESAARYADDAGFAVTTIEDCCASANPDWHNFSIQNILPLFGAVTNTEQFLGNHGR